MGSERGKLHSWNEVNGENEDNENRNGSVLLVTSHTLAFMGWCCQSLSGRKRRRRGGAAGRELFSGIWELDGIGEFKNEEWSWGAFRE